MKQIVFILELTLLLVSCLRQKNDVPNISNSKWEWELDNHCINRLEFTEQQYSEYNCELGESWKGVYFIKGDTIVLQTEVLNSNVPSKGKPIMNISKMVYHSTKGLSLIYYKEWDYQSQSWDEEWIKSPKILFKKK